MNNSDYFPEPAGGEDFVYIRENPAFNQNPFRPKFGLAYETYRNIFDGVLPLSMIEMIIWSVKNLNPCKPDCKGIILFDHNNKTYDMNYRPYFPLPTLYINGTTGENINDSVGNYTIDYWVNQRWNTSIESYNVIGQINGTNENETDIVCCLYDSWWNQGTADSAIGMGMVLAIAKYMKELEDLGIEPKRNVKFIAFGGEEYAMRGAFYYEKKYRKDEKINTVIDLNQLGFSQTTPRLTFDVFLNKESYYGLTPVIEEIKDTSNLLDRTGNVYDFSTVNADKKNGWPVISDYLPFVDRIGITTLSFIKTKGPEEKLMKWKLHHRSGENHSQGDVMTYCNKKDVNVTTEFIWNVTKYFTINPDCNWSDGEPTYWAFDNTSYDNNDEPDTVRINFSISTIMPRDRIRVSASLQTIYDSGDNPPHDGPIPDSGNVIVPDIPLFRDSGPDGILDSTTYSYNYIPSPPQTVEYDGDLAVAERINESDNIFMDRNGAVTGLCGIGDYESSWENASLYWGDEDAGDATYMNYSGSSNWVSKDYTITQDGINGSFDITIPGYSPNATYEIKLKVYNSTGIIDGIPQLEWSNETNLSANNDQPSGLDSMTISSNTILLMVDVEENILQTGLIDLIVNASDPNSDNIEIQAVFINTSGKIQFTNWTRPLAQGVNHTQQFTWTLPDVTEVRVRTRDIKRSHNQMSSWSDPLNITLNATCQAYVSPLIEIPNENITFKGLQYGIDNITSWEWDFDDDTTNSSQNTTHSFNQTGSYQIILNVTDNQSNVYTNNITVTILYIISDFNMSENSVKINESITFTNSSKSYYDNITNLTWDFGDGTNIYENNTPVHNYSSEGVYNVSFTVTDNQSHNHTLTKTVYVDSTPPEVLVEPAPSGPIGLGSPVTIYGNFFDNISGVDTVKVNITYPNETSVNHTMNLNSSIPFDYMYVFNDTWQIGQYFYRLWVVDNANNSKLSAYRSFTIQNLFGITTKGDKSQDVTDRITGSWFTVYENGTPNNITAYIRANMTPYPEVKCHIYKTNVDNLKLQGTTESKIVSTGDKPEKIVFNFTGTPKLIGNNSYLVVCWSNISCFLSFYNVSSNVSQYKTETYGDPPWTITDLINEKRYYSMYLSYSTKPTIENASITKESIGLGENVTISADAYHKYSGVLLVLTEVEYPDNTSLCYIMENPENNTYQFTFDDTWTVGQYNYTIWAYDRLARANNLATENFTISANATMSICTLKDSYGSNESLNITDPPPGEGSSPVGYKLFDNDTVLHIWNNYDSYYFNTTSGIQLTNHYDEYWSHNVMMLGYYNNDEWNLVYRTDELTGFTQDIETDNTTFVNVTYWKNLTYQGYDFRLSIRYNLEIDDFELAVIPYIKNLGDAIPYNLGFAWEIKDIRIDNDTLNDQIRVNNTEYLLNQTLDIVYTNLSKPVYIFNDTTNETEFIGYTPIQYFYLENLYNGYSNKTLVLRWDESLDYVVRVKSRDGQYNAPVTLGIKIGTLAVDQEKHTEMFWHDSLTLYERYTTQNSSMTAFRPIYDDSWAAQTFTVGNTGANESHYIGRVKLDLIGPPRAAYGNLTVGIRATSSGLPTGDDLTNGSITNVDDGGWYEIALNPYVLSSSTTYAIVAYEPDATITNAVMWRSDWGDANYTGGSMCSSTDGGENWTENEDCDFWFEEYGVIFPVISNPVPSDNSTNVSTFPTLSINVSHEDNELMNITWLSNSSGSWLPFGSNSSVGDGAYSQVFSNATVNGQWWYWKVNVSDGTDYVVSDVYRFYTGVQSKISNMGSTNISGYLCVIMEYYKETSGNWTYDFTVIDGNLITVNSSEEFGIETVFNGLLNTDYLSYGNGTYRVYAALYDPYGDVLVCDDDTKLEATYEFEYSEG